MSDFQESSRRKAMIWLGVLLVTGAAAAAVLFRASLQDSTPARHYSTAAKEPAPARRLEPSRVPQLHPQARSAERQRSALEPIDRALDDLVQANVAFNAPDHGRVGDKLLIAAKLSTRLSQAELKQLIGNELQHLPGGTGKLESVDLRASSRMVASLSGGPAFDISPSEPQEQWVSDEDVTSWLWEVVPKIAGRQTLVLRLEAIVSVDGKDGRRNVEPLIRPIEVSVASPRTVEEWLDYIQKVGENISWIWGTLVLPVGGAIWVWLKKRSSPEAGQS